MSTYRLNPLFIPSDFGDLFAMHFLPSDRNVSKCILHIPAFAEEMNKSRQMVNIQARAFVEQGYSVLLLDLWGTGDSHGDFYEATWDTWLKNISSAINWIQEQGYQTISLWGLRTGVMLAIDFLQQYQCKIDKLICWQPVLNGELFIMRFIRLRVTTSRIDKNSLKESSSELKQNLLDGKSVEVAGYLLNPDLVNPMMNIQPKKYILKNINTFHLFEIVAAADQDATNATRQWFDSIKRQGYVATLDVIYDDPFWATQDISESPDLIQLTSKRLIE